MVRMTPPKVSRGKFRADCTGPMGDVRLIKMLPSNALYGWVQTADGMIDVVYIGNLRRITTGARLR